MILMFYLLWKMVEISASMELKAKSGELVESVDTDFADISFEDFLAQEKKDSFWYASFLGWLFCLFVLFCALLI